MEGIYQHYIIDLSSNNNFVQIPAMQGDGNNVRGFEVELIQNGVQYVIDAENTGAVIAGTKPDGKEIFNSCEITEEGYITVDIDAQMTAAYGKAVYSVILIDKTSNSRISSFPFILITNKAPYDPSYIISTDEFTMLYDLINKALKDYEYVMENAQASADAAKISEQNAKQSEEMSKEYADNATESESNAKMYADNALSSSNSAADSANSANESEIASASSASEASVSAENAAASASDAGTKADEAAASASSAKISENNSKTSETNSKESEINAKSSETAASASASDAYDSAATASAKADEASISAANAKASETVASNKAQESSEYADLSKSYAVGTDNSVRENDSIDNSKYYYEQARQISEGLNGALLPMGTITFSQLSSQTKQPGYMYNISDEFVTTTDFREGAGHTIPAGTNVYCTADLKWDCLAGSPVTGVKGDSESAYRKGNVNITKENIGLPDVENKSSEMIRSEITSKNVTDALGYIPSYEIISDAEPVSDFWLQEY